MSAAYLVTGGAGYLGRNLVRALLERGDTVHVLERVDPPEKHTNLRWFIGDLRNPADVVEAMRGVDVVFHTAALITTLGFVDSATRKLNYDVNVGGTENVLRACAELGVTRLVYTSSNNVAFVGEVHNGDESLPYPRKFIDIYTETKVAAEKLVLAANGRNGLLTCALRPGGIYGPDEQTYLPRVARAAQKGLFKFIIGNGSALADNVYIDNLVRAHLLAAERLVPGSPAAGQAYFISDGQPMNYFEFFRAIVEGLGYDFPRRSLPAGPFYAAAWLAEFAHRVFKTPRPFITRMELKKITVTNYFRIDKAKQDLGYEPLVSTSEGLRRCLSGLEKYRRQPGSP